MKPFTSLMTSCHHGDRIRSAAGRDFVRHPQSPTPAFLKLGGDFLFLGRDMLNLKITVTHLPRASVLLKSH